MGKEAYGGAGSSQANVYMVRVHPPGWGCQRPKAPARRGSVECSTVLVPWGRVISDTATPHVRLGATRFPLGKLGRNAAAGLAKGYRELARTIRVLLPIPSTSFSSRVHAP